MIELPRLETLEFGEACLAKMERFVFLSMNDFTKMMFRESMFEDCYFW